MSNTHRDARLLGYHREHELLIDLHRMYPGESFRLGYKETFDLYHPRILIDHVGVSMGRLIIDKKSGCTKHTEEANRLGCVGYISFLYDGYYHFLPITSEYARIHKRPMINPMLLRSCVIDPVVLSNNSKPIISREYVKELKERLLYEQYKNMPKHANKTPQKGAYLLQEETQRRIYTDAVIRGTTLCR